MQTQSLKTDLVVVGGGLAGVSAAVAAARSGLQVALINNRPVLGGNSSSEVRVWVCGATAHGNQRWARETGIIGEMLVENQFRNPEGNPIYWDDVVLDTVRREKNIKLFLNTDVHEVDATGPYEKRYINSLTGWTIGSETLTIFQAPLIVDATGDGLIGDLAGARFRLGKEARNEFQEDWAPEKSCHEFLGSTLLFYTKDLGKPVKFIKPETTIDISTTSIPATRVIRTGDNGAHYWWIEWGGELDIVADNEKIRDELRGVILGVWDYIKNSGKFDADTLTLEWIGNVPGKREYRRFIGDYTLTQNDIILQRHFPDSIGYGGWSIDLHPSEGMYSSVPGARQRFSNGVFEIPFRSLYSANVSNLLMAGRDFSATHIAFGAARVMATCAVMGEAVGTAAHLCLQQGISPRELALAHAPELQQTLLRNDSSLIGIRNEDPQDLARYAHVTASSFMRSIGTYRGNTHYEDTSKVDLIEPEHQLPLQYDLAIVTPVNPELTSMQLLLDIAHDTELTVEVWSSDLPQNIIPVHREHQTTRLLSATKSPKWFNIETMYRPVCPGNAIVILRANNAISLFMSDYLPPGVMLLQHQPDSDDQNVDVDTDSLLMRWPSKPLRGRSVEFCAHPNSEALAPCQAVGGYQRPFGGPNMWASQPMREDKEEWLRLDWDNPVEAEEVRVVFDDDVDVDLNTLHRHRYPHEVIPHLVRDYRIEVLPTETDRDWVVIASVCDNHHRHRIHSLKNAGTFRALRLVILCTNGIPEARVVSLRVQR